LFYGMIGAVIVVAMMVAVLVATGATDRGTRTIVVERAPVALPVVEDSERSPSAVDVYRRAAPSVVFVDAVGVDRTQSTSEYLKGEGGQQQTATGSGFEVDDHGTILTSLHVVANAAKIVVGLDDGKSARARMIEEDASLDLAVLRVTGAGGLTFHPLLLGNSRDVRVGEPVFAIGNPFGLGRTLTTGIVSGVQRRIQSPSGVVIDGALQTDAPINPGNSGGPLLDGRGAVIGINSQIETAGEGGGNVGIAFAVPIDSATAKLAAVR
jgi:S1-C subfamily serine protease